MTAYRYDENRDRLVAENVYQIPPKVQGSRLMRREMSGFQRPMGGKILPFIEIQGTCGSGRGGCAAGSGGGAATLFRGACRPEREALYRV